MGKKVLSTVEDYAVGIMTAIGEAGAAADSIGAVVHGTTIATNAILEGTGARTALITTGPRDRDPARGGAGDGRRHVLGASSARGLLLGRRTGCCVSRSWTGPSWPAAASPGR